MIPESEQPTLDIDWFFVNKDKIGFAASAGGKLPESVAKSRTNIALLSGYFRALPAISKVELNPKLNEILPHHEIDESYLSDFVFMAEKGLYAFDKTIPGNFSDDNYHLVAKPLVSLNIKDLPINVVDILLQTRNDIDISEHFKGSMFP